MGRRRKANKVTLTTINISVESADTISKLKNRKETQDDFIRRLLADWQDFQDLKLDMDQVLKLKDKKISTLEVERSKSKHQQQQSFVTTSNTTI
jgi:hypothetical protein